MARLRALLLVPLLAGLTLGSTHAAPAGSQDPGDAALSGGPPQLAIRAAQHVRFQRRWHQRLEREPTLKKLSRRRGLRQHQVGVDEESVPVVFFRLRQELLQALH
ncbi:MAG: hypothetical protein GY856_00430 [bacterium]|nr:hypothetical protein [bacterium]